MKLGSSSSKKEDGTRSGGDLTEKDANDDLASIPAILEKLEQMMDMVSKVSTEVTEKYDSFDMIASFFSLLHLYEEIYAKDPDYRDKQYDDIRKDDDVQLEEVNELVEYLDYAHWAYEDSFGILNKNCKQAGLDLISHDPATEPGRVGHYVALRHKEKLVIIGLKGTSTFSDVLTDLIAIPKEHVGCHFDDELFSAETTARDGKAGAVASMRCHEGIFTAAIWMADHLQDMIENLFVPLNYRVVICGHSLGAGTACLLGLELRSRIKAFRKNYTDLRVIAFAAPPVVSFKASKACAPFVTAVVNNSDVITRCSVSNLAVMNKLLLLVLTKLKEKGLEWNSMSAMKRWYDEHSKIDDDLLLTEKELDDFFEQTHAAPENEEEALFVPGRVVVVWDKGENDDYQMGGIVTDCGMRMLRQVELSVTFITDHLVNVGYRPNLLKLQEQLQNSI